MRGAIGGSQVPASNDSGLEVFEGLDGGLKIDTSVGDGDTMFQSAGSFGWDVLAAFVDVRLDHHSDDRAIAGVQLLANLSDNFGLISVILERIAMRTIDHDSSWSLGPSFSDSFPDELDGFGVVIWLRAPASKDHVNVDVSGRFDDTGQALVVDAEERVGTVGRAHRIDRHAHPAIRRILEPDRMRRS